MGWSISFPEYDLRTEPVCNASRAANNEDGGELVFAASAMRDPRDAEIAVRSSEVGKRGA
jgi:hypothetical protein